MSDQMRRRGVFDSNIDPAVEATLQDAQRREQRRLMTPGQVKKARRDAARRGKRLYLDVSGDLIAALREVAKLEGVTISNLAAFLLTRGLNDILRGDLDLRPDKQPARALQYEFKLRVKSIVDHQGGKAKKK